MHVTRRTKPPHWSKRLYSGQVRLPCGRPTLTLEEQLRWAAAEGRAEEVITLLNMGVAIESADEVRHVHDPMLCLFNEL